MQHIKIGSNDERNAPTGFYMCLYQGRDDPIEREKYYNVEGVMIGPILWAGSTIQGDIAVSFKNAANVTVECNDGRFKFDGVVYNDWAVSHHVEGEIDPEFDETDEFNSMFDK